MAISYSLLNQVSVFIIICAGFLLGFWVYSSNRKSKINQTFLLFTSFLILWTSFPLFFNSPNISSSLSLFFVRLAYGTTALFFIPFYLFIQLFPSENKKYPITKTIVFLASISAFALTTFTNLHVYSIEKANWGISPIFGIGKNFYFGIISLLIAIIFISIFKKYKTLDKKELLKIQYLITGFIVFIVLNLIFNIIVPLFYNTLVFYPLGNYSAIFLLGFTALAIVRQNLFGIKVVLTQIFIVLIALLLLVNFLTSGSIFEYVWKGAILGLFVLFGWLLIRSVVKEIRQKEQIDKYAKDLATANTSLQVAYAKLQTLDKAKSEFISIASHQLRTPLTAIKGYISMMIEGDYGKLSKTALQSMKNVYLANERLVKLVNSLLDMSRIEAGRITLDFKPVKVDALIADILRELRNEAESKSLKLRMVKDKVTLPEIEADPTKLRDSIMNLIDNAIKYTDKGEILAKIKYKSFEGDMEITIQDTGEGMSQEEIDKLFQSFSRAESGRKNWAEGSGLGLYIAKKFVEMHHGTIHAESPGKGLGSKFIIELPISQPQS